MWLSSNFIPSTMAPEDIEHPAALARLVSPLRNSLLMAALLAAVGGFLDAFTYFGHGRVFANAMSGNIVLLGAFAAARDWRQGFRHLTPIAAFLLGVATAQLPRLPAIRKFITDAAPAALAVEIAFLMAAGFYPENSPDVPLVLGISFVAALQSSTFDRVHEWSYSSTMTTGNLRHLAKRHSGLCSSGRIPRPCTRLGSLVRFVCLFWEVRPSEPCACHSCIIKLCGRLACLW